MGPPGRSYFGVFLHGIYLVAERAMGRHRFATGSETVPAGEGAFPSAAVLGRILLTYGLVCVAWVFFRAESLGDALLIFALMLFAFGPVSELLAMLSAEAASLLVIVCLLALEWIGRWHWNPIRFERAPILIRWAAYTAAVWLVLLFGTRQSEEFIYFRF